MAGSASTCLNSLRIPPGSRSGRNHGISGASCGGTRAEADAANYRAGVAGDVERRDVEREFNNAAPVFRNGVLDAAGGPRHSLASRTWVLLANVRPALASQRGLAFSAVLKAAGGENGRHFSATDNPTELIKMKRPFEQAR